MFRSLALASTLVVLCSSAIRASEPCDPAGTDAAALASAYAAIDFACDCALATSRGEYRGCARSAVTAAVEAESLRPACRREALRYAKLARCGMEGAVVCCRLDTTRDGRERHRILDAAECTGDARYATCISGATSIVTGCSATGCNSVCGDYRLDGDEECEVSLEPYCDSGCRRIPHCGDGIVGPDEQCEPPGTDTCSLACQTRDCDVVPEGCGDLSIGAGETCDPPGVEDCSNLCQAAPCSAPAMGELAIACVEGTSELAAAGADDRYLVAWTGRHRRDGELLARRFDADGVPVDATLTIVSDGASCDANAGAPSAASDGTDFVAAWGRDTYEYGGPVGRGSGFMAWRQIDGGGAVGELKAESYGSSGIGSCSGLWWTLPTTAAGAPSSPFAVGWGQIYSRCAYWHSTVGRFYDAGADPETTSASHSWPISIYAGQVGNSSAAMLGDVTLWVAYGVASDGMGNWLDFLSAAWSDGAGASSPLSLGTRGHDASAYGRPAVAAGSSSFLVAWREGDPALNAIRAMRVTRASGRIDANGGLLLASAAGTISGGPSVAFDGTRWLVAWTETGMGGNDLKAVAMNTDGSIVDATPRTLATQVAAQDPAMASTGDGEVLVAFRRDDVSGWSALRAVIVAP